MVFDFHNFTKSKINLMKNILPVLLILTIAFTACKPRETPHRTTTDKYEAPAVDPSEYESRAPATPGPPEPSLTAAEAITDDNPHPPQVTLEPLDVPDSLFASIERTPCYGTCPTYRFKVYESGFAEYEGIRFVDSVGTFTVQVPQLRLQQLKELLHEVNYFSFQDKYIDPFITDIPHTITIVQLDGRVKRVLNGHEGTPEGLVIFERFIDGLVQESGFTNKPRFDD
jgi:hypothetical protein